MKNEKKAKEVADERMSLIAPLLAPNLDPAQKRGILRGITENGGPSERTVSRWLKDYREGGFDGLMPSGRESGKRKIPESLVDEAIELRRELPSRSIVSIIRVLELEHKAEPGFLRKSTLQDAMARRGYSASMMKIYQDKGYASQRFQRVHRQDLWQGDLKTGPVIKVNGVNTKTYFSCLIDDATRFIVHGEFYDNMNQGIVEDTLRKAVTKYGIPRRLFFDNGSQYRTGWMKRACALLGIRLIYAKPRNPQGKGKQERFNETLDQFIDENSLKPAQSLRELNDKFEAWLSECYHTSVHSALGTTPEICFRSDSMPINFAPPDLLARAFLHCVSRKADKSGCISFEGRSYDLGVEHAGRRVDVIYDPSCTDTLTIEAEGCVPFRVEERRVLEHTAKRPKRREPEKIAETSRLLDAVQKAYGERVTERRRAISYSSEVHKGDGDSV